MSRDDRMHAVTDETAVLVDAVLGYARERMLSTDTPLDHPATAADLARRAGRTVTEEGIGAERALEVFGEVLAPACITTDHPDYLAFIPTAPTKAATAFDLVVSATAVYGGSWLEGSGAVHAENEVLTFLAAEFGLPDGAGGVFVQGGTLGNLSALVAARESAVARRGDRGGRAGRAGSAASAEPSSGTFAPSDDSAAPSEGRTGTSGEPATRLDGSPTAADGSIRPAGESIAQSGGFTAAPDGSTEPTAESTALPDHPTTSPGRWVVVCNAEAHSSIASAARVMDVDIVTVDPGESGVLTGAAVRPALEQYGERVFAVVATAGSTNFGIVDDLASIAALKDDFEFWLHIDGAYGLAGMLSPLARPYFSGVERADSLIVDPHKWLFAPFDACALIYRDPEAGRRAHTQHAEYLDTLTEAVEWSPSDYAVQLTRRARGLPLWFSLASHGAGAYRDAITSSIRLARRVADEIESRPTLHLVGHPQLSVVVFERDGWSKEDYAAWSTRLLDAQRAFVTPSSHAGRPAARFALLNPRTTFESLVGILDSME